MGAATNTSTLRLRARPAGIWLFAIGSFIPGLFSTEIAIRIRPLMMSS